MVKDNSDFFISKNAWSEIKDRLLGRYIRIYFQKLLSTRKPICYIDCFAGKGIFDDGNYGSPLIALKARDDSLQYAKGANKNGIIDMSFIELNHYTDLESNIYNYGNTKNIEIIAGKYEEKIIDLLSRKVGYNVFLYIDPYGIKALDYYLFSKFTDYKFNTLELLINFNSFGFFRDACRAMGVATIDEVFQDLSELKEYAPTRITHSEQSKDLLSQIAGGDYWKNIVLSYNRGEIDGYKAEKILSNEYKKRIQKIFTYVLDMPIRLKPRQRPKYRMIHACNHVQGCYHMAENMEKRKDELFLNIQQGSQLSLFDSCDQARPSIENELVTSKMVEDLIWKYLLKVKCKINLTRLFADFFNENGLLCNFLMIRKAILQLEQRKKLIIERDPPTTSNGKKSTFLTESNKQKVFIRST
ncbi:three-Cys-motif partner protein TcmP [Desulfovibrio sp. ZJ200]|uniref:three-Cys-motif partner protein TcmP n=1 Tax=Desulfovibrio sp. ZJ200 TaxID=2709792 RepID=UPI0013EAF321|nr:three-Cys-motif partner protein TcmP [Desulfovibrio sp. ZJ200]